MVRTIAFGLGVIQGMLVARQLFGAQGLNQWYPFNQVQMEQALVALTGKMLKSEEQQAPKVDNMVEIFAKVSLIFLALSNSKLSSNFMHIINEITIYCKLVQTESSLTTNKTEPPHKLVLSCFIQVNLV